MQAPPPSQVAGTPLAVLGEALELVLARGASDLSLSPRRISAVVADLVDRLLHPHAAPEDTVTVAARLLAAPLEEITTDPNLRLYRTRQLLPPHKVRQQDTHCLQWLARQPGRSIREKISTRNRLLAVTRNLSPARLEHSFALLVCSRLEPLVRRYLDDVDSAHSMGERGSHRLHLARQLSSALADFRQFAANHGIPEPHHFPLPNNVLLHERRYRRVWLASRWLAEQDSRSISIKQAAAPLWQELVAFFTAAALQRLGFTFVETGYAPHEPSARTIGGQFRWVGHWFQTTEQFFRKLRIQLAPNGDVLVWLLHTDAQSSNTKCFRVSTSSSAAADWGMPLDSTLSEGWNGLADETELLFQAISEWLGISAAPASKHRPAAERAGDAFIRASGRSLRFYCNGQNTVTPACAVGLNPADHLPGRHPSLYLSGADANWFRTFRGAEVTDFAGEAPLSGDMARSWILPGYFFRACSSRHLFRVESCRALLHSLVTGTPIRRLIAAAPHRLSYAGLARFHDALPNPLERKWTIPQSVAIALAWREQHLPAGAEHVWFGFLDLESELPDFAFLQCKRLDPEDSDLGWLRYPAFSRNPPPTLHWPNKVAVGVLARHGFATNRRQVGILLAQLTEGELIRIATGGLAAVHAWVRHQCSWHRVAVNQADVLPVLQQWAQATCRHVQREMEQRPKCAPAKVIVSGALSAVTVVQEALRKLSVTVEFTAEDLAPRGLAVFGHRLREGLPTYRDFIPDLRISIRGVDGRSFWHRLFAGEESGREAAVDRVLEGDEFQFSLAANKKIARLPLMSEQERAVADPVIRLASPPIADCPILVRARYEAAGRGLVLSLRSETPGLIPYTELEWDNLDEDSIDEGPPALPKLHCLSFKPDEVSAVLDDFRHAFQRLGATRDPQAAADLKKATKGLSKLLQRNVSSSCLDEWAAAAQSPSANDLAELLARLAFLLEISVRESVSPIFPQSSSAFKRPAGKVDLSILAKDSDLQFQLHTCLSRFTAAAPDSYLRHCLSAINTPRTRLSVRQACIYSLGRSASAWTDSGPRREAIERIISEITEFTRNGSLAKSEKWQEFGWWVRALAFYLAGNPWQIPKLPVTLLSTLTTIIADAISQLSVASCEDDNTWSAILASLLFLRYAMRIPGQGVPQFGPKSDLSRRLVQALELAARSSAVRSVARVSLRRFVQNPEVLQGENYFVKVASIWQGKAAGVLLRANVEDE